MTDVVVIGGGQAGLAAGYFLRRAQLDYVILDQQPGPGGAWLHGWDSLRLFSPAEYSPLPGWRMPPQDGETFPTAAHVTGYLRDYEQRYDLPIHRPVRVTAVTETDGTFTVHTDTATWHAPAVISATGTWGSPHTPRLPGADQFSGTQQHTVDYRNPAPFAGQRVVVVGGGNSAAQILAELAPVAHTLWATVRPPRFMPRDVDGRVLFDVATARAAAQRAGIDADSISDLGDIVMVPPVVAAYDRGDLHATTMFDHLTATGVAWADGTHHPCDAIIWCTGFRPHLPYLDPLGLTSIDGHPATHPTGDAWAAGSGDGAGGASAASSGDGDVRAAGTEGVSGTQSVDYPGLHVLGYGDWTGFASATLIGAGRTAKQAIATIRDHLAAR